MEAWGSFGNTERERENCLEFDFWGQEAEKFELSDHSVAEGQGQFGNTGQRSGEPLVEAAQHLEGLTLGQSRPTQA